MSHGALTSDSFYLEAVSFRPDAHDAILPIVARLDLNLAVPHPPDSVGNAFASDRSQLLVSRLQQRIELRTEPSDDGVVRRLHALGPDLHAKCLSEYFVERDE